MAVLSPNPPANGCLPEVASVPAGDWQEWGEKWVAIGSGSHSCLYRPLDLAPRNDAAALHRLYYESLRESLAALASPIRGLELGAGRGTTSQYLTADGHHTTLVDLAPQGLQLAQKNFARYKLAPPTCVVADICNTELPAGAYDCVYSVGTLEHFDDIKPVLAESLRLLRFGGLVWHIIVQVKGKDKRMTRVHRQPREYFAAMRELGQWAHCAEFSRETPEVLLLHCWKQ